MVLYNKLTRNTWGAGDFDSGSHNVTGTIYTDGGLTTAFDLTGYTIEIVLFDTVRNARFKGGLTGAIVDATAGEWKLIIADGELSQDFSGEVIVVLTKAGTELSAVGVAGSSKILIYSTGK